MLAVTLGTYGQERRWQQETPVGVIVQIRYLRTNVDAFLGIFELLQLGLYSQNFL